LLNVDKYNTCDFPISSQVISDMHVFMKHDDDNCWLAISVTMGMES